MWMRLAFGHLQFTPAVFWSMSLKEWQACYEGYREKEFGGTPDEPLGLSDLETLMERYPDK